MGSPDAPTTPPPAAPAKLNRLRRLHTRLRGRYRWAMLAAAVAAIGGAAIGWLIEPPAHRAVVRVAVNAAPDADAAHRFALTDRHARLARSASVAALALEDADLLAALARAHDSIATPDDLLAAATLTADDDAVRIAVDHADPAVASAAAAAIARALLTAHRTAELADADALAAARQRRNDQLERLAGLEDQRRALLAAAGPVPLDQAYQAKLREVDQITAAITEAELSLTRSAANESATPPVAPPGAPGAPGAPAPLDLDRMALTDRKLASLLLTRRDIERRIAEAADRLGESAPAMIRLRGDLVAVRKQIDQHLASGGDPFDPFAALVAGGAGAASNANAEPTAAALRARLLSLRRMDAQARADLTILAQSRSHLDRLTAEITDAQPRLDTAQLAADARSAAAESRGSLAEPQAAAPVTVIRDRRPAHAAIGAAVGFASAYALALLVLIADRRILRPADAVADSAGTLLGSVPTITPDQTDPRDADLTALSIHQIRALIEVRARARSEHAFAITSPSKGAGKTSLTVGLASSLALSGTRTLLVDCELGSRLADRSDDQRTADQSLDEVMVQMGYLDPREQDLFVFQDNATIGLLGMLGGRSLEQCAVRSSIPGLSVLPALAADAHDIGKMSTTFLRRIIDEAAGEYDMILFDTGPIPGSIEAMLVAGVVDGVVIVASRGEDQHRYNRTLAYLEMVGATIAGTVFNRADRRDLTLSNAEGRRGRRNKPQPAPFGAKTTRRLPPPPGMGSGILAAAVHAQAQTQARRGDLQVSPQATKNPATPAKLPSRPKPTPQPKPVVSHAGPKAAAAEGPGRTAKPEPASTRADSPTQITVADAGDIASILDEAATIADASSDRDMTEDALEKMLAGKTEAARRAAHATPLGKDGKPLGVADELDADARMTSAIDELLSDAGAADPGRHTRAPKIHVDPGEPTRRRS